MSMTPVIKFERVIRDCPWNDGADERVAKGEKADIIYDFHVLLNNEHRATWKRAISGRRGYELVVAADFHQSIERPNPNKTSVWAPSSFNIKVRSQDDFHARIVENLDLIPTLAQIAKIKADRDAMEKQKVKDEEERLRIRRLEQAAPDHALFCRGVTLYGARWNAFGGNMGEVCIGGFRYATSLDEFDVPILTDTIRRALINGDIGA